MLKKTQHLQLPEDPFTRDQILEDVGHLFECNSLSVSRICDWPAEQKMQNITPPLVHVLLKSSYHSQLKCWVKTMQIHCMGTKVLSKACHTLHSRVCIKRAWSVWSPFAYSTHTQVSSAAPNWLSTRTSMHTLLATGVHSEINTPAKEQLWPQISLHPKKDFTTNKMPLQLHRFDFTKEDKRCNYPTQTAPCQIQVHHSITESFCICRSKGTQHLSFHKCKMGMTPGFLSKCLCDAGTVVQKF